MRKCEQMRAWLVSPVGGEQVAAAAYSEAEHEVECEHPADHQVGVDQCRVLEIGVGRKRVQHHLWRNCGAVVGCGF